MGTGGLVETVGNGITHLVLGAIGAIGAGVGTMVAQLQVWLPGPLLPIVAGATGLLFVLWLLRK